MTYCKLIVCYEVESNCFLIDNITSIRYLFSPIAIYKVSLNVSCFFVFFFNFFLQFIVTLLFMKYNYYLIRIIIIKLNYILKVKRKVFSQIKYCYYYSNFYVLCLTVIYNL